MVSMRSEDEAAPLRLLVAGQQVVVDCQSPLIRNALIAAWGPALELGQTPGLQHEAPLAPLSSIQVDEQGRLWIDGTLRRDDQHLLDRPQQIEKHIVCDLLSRRSEALQLHAGCVRWGSTAILVLGESGAGKSTFTRLLVQAGATYLSDDCLLVEGQRAFGMSRTIQFDSVQDGQPIPSYLLDCDWKSYRSLTGDGAGARVPLWREPCQVVGSLELDAQPWAVLQLNRGASNRLHALSRAQRVAALASATLTCGQPYRKQFGWGPSWSVTWNDPARCFASLVAQLPQA